MPQTLPLDHLHTAYLDHHRALNRLRRQLGHEEGRMN